MDVRLNFIPIANQKMLFDPVLSWQHVISSSITETDVLSFDNFIFLLYPIVSFELYFIMTISIWCVPTVYTLSHSYPDTIERVKYMYLPHYGQEGYIDWIPLHAFIRPLFLAYHYM